jgi:hypothetical protein
MTWWRALVVAAFVPAGCKQASPPTPTSQAPAPAADAAVVKALADAIATGAQRGMKLSAPKRPGRPEDCRGADVDLAVAMTSQACVTRRTPTSKLPRGVDIVGPKGPIAVAAGATVTVPVTLENETANPVEVFVDASCGGTRVFQAEAFHDVERADLRRSDKCIAETTSCQIDDVLITIEPHGRARFDVGYSAIERAFDDECETKPVGPLPKGRYDLEVFSHWTLRGSNTNVGFRIPLDVN